MAEIQTNPSHVGEVGDIHISDIDLGRVELLFNPTSLIARIDSDAATFAAGQAALQAISKMYGFDGALWRRIAVNGAGNLVVVGGGGVAPLNTFVGAAPAAVAVGVASTPVIAANAARKYLAISVTTPGRRVSLGLNGNAAVLDSGITIFTGTTYIFDASGITTGAVTAIANAAGSNIGVQEGS